ncbi:MFS transporter [uncultured Neglectibacter sp.]|uniref:MFS transporter n=1 Tax=uncultured Neglectibacter sp. TaxID=1924108 RepID=UPI0034DE6232
MKNFRFKGSYLSYVLIYFFSYFAMASFVSVLSVYLTNIGKSGGEMSFIVSASGIFSFAMLPFTGYLCDRTGKSRFISGALLVAMGAMALIFSQCRQVWALFLLEGLLMACLNSAMPISERLAAATKFRYGVLRVWGTIGYAAGAQAAGLAIQHFPPIILFALVFLSTVIAAIGFAGAEDPILPAAPEQEREEKRRPPLSSFLKNPQFLLFLLIAFLFYASSGVNFNYAAYLLDTLGVPTGAVGTVLAVGTLVELPIILFSNKFMDRFSGKTLLLLACGMNVVQFLCYGLTRDPLIVVAVMILLKALAATLFMMLILKIVRNLVAPELTTTGISVVNSVTSLGTIVMQNVGGSILDSSNIHVLYLVLAGLTAAAMVLTLFLRVENREKVFG